MEGHVEQSDAMTQAPGTAQAYETDNFSTPATDVFETTGEIVILMDVPGVDSGDLDIDLGNQTLTVTAKRKQSEEEGAAIRCEYKRCGYFRHFRIPQSVDQARISASLIDGVLRLVLPKTGRLERRTVRIKAE